MILLPGPDSGKRAKRQREHSAQHRPTLAFRQLATAPLNGMLYLRKTVTGNKAGEVTVILHLKYPQILSTLAKTTSLLNNGKVGRTPTLNNGLTTWAAIYELTRTCETIN